MHETEWPEGFKCEAPQLNRLILAVGLKEVFSRAAVVLMNSRTSPEIWTGFFKESFRHLII
jgi:hypothetical protein